MDPVSPNLLAGLAVEAVKGIVAHWKSTKSDRAKRDTARNIKTISGRIESNAIEYLSRLSMFINDENRTHVAKFLHSAEFRNIARTVAVAVISNELDRVRNFLIEQMSAMLRLRLDLKAANAGPYATDLISTLSISINAAMTTLRKNDQDEYVLVRQQANIELLAGRLKAVADQTRTIEQCNYAVYAEVVQFASEYCRVLRATTDEISPADFDAQKRVSLEDIYVTPRFDPEYPQQFGIRESDPIERDPSFVSLTQLKLHTYRLVVLGDPGAGKSTLVQRVANDLAGEAQGEDSMLAQVPFVVTLRRYEEQKRSKNCSLVDYLVSAIREELHLATSRSVIEYLLASGRAIVIFDGLDELIETHRRREITQSIEAFSASYPTAHMMVTSRIVGYREAPLSPKIFKVASLLPFSERDVETYAQSWFGLDRALTPSERSSVAIAFLKESESIRDLRRNALMLGLLCNVYRGERSIPRSRAELYEQCSRMLFDRWDASRGISSVKILRSDARTALQDVALWIFTDSKLAEGVSEKKLEQRIANHWLGRRFETIEQATDEAHELMKSWRGRAWVLTDIGTKESGGRIYKFTHQTFLEYFASIELVRKHPSPKLLWSVLMPAIRRGEWDVVAQVAIQILDGLYDGGTDAIFTMGCKLVEDESALLEHRYNVAYFLSRYLDVLSPSPAVCRMVISACTKLAVAGQMLSGYPSNYLLTEGGGFGYLAFAETSGTRLGDDGEDVLDAEDLLDPLLIGLHSHADTSTLAVDEFTQCCIRMMRSANIAYGAQAFVLLGNVDRLIFIAENRIDYQLHDHLLECSLSALRERSTLGLVSRKLKDWSVPNFRAALTAWRHRLITRTSFAEACPIEALLTDRPLITHEDLQSQIEEPAAISLLRDFLLGDLDDGLWPDVERSMSVLGQKLRLNALTPPFFGAVHYTGERLLGESIIRPYFRAVHGSPPDELARRRDAAKMKFDNDVILGASVLLGAIIEHEIWELIDESEDQVAFLDLGPLQPLEMAFIARMEEGMYFTMRDSLSSLDLEVDNRRLITSWAERKVDFSRAIQRIRAE
ncbi:NACHT domain-containing protein [Catellatospora sp. NPDC049111]|uniref:NACHT domain-containing protein n=1 Tax=Catellatospora sp. NPDC049111 TaxID=3155271 RepID=UPI0033E35F7A